MTTPEEQEAAIDAAFAQLQTPAELFGFFYKQDGPDRFRAWLKAYPKEIVNKHTRKIFVQASGELEDAGMTEAANIVWEVSAELPHVLDFCNPFNLYPVTPDARNWFNKVRQHWGLCRHCGSEYEDEDICEDGKTTCQERNRQEKLAYNHLLPRNPRPIKSETRRKWDLNDEDFQRWKEQRRANRDQISTLESPYKWVTATVLDPDGYEDGYTRPEHQRWRAKKQAGLQ